MQIVASPCCTAPNTLVSTSPQYTPSAGGTYARGWSPRPQSGTRPRTAATIAARKDTEAVPCIICETANYDNALALLSTASLREALAALLGCDLLRPSCHRHNGRDTRHRGRLQPVRCWTVPYKKFNYSLSCP